VITQVLYGWYVGNRHDGLKDRCPWGLVWDQAHDKDAVKPCQKERGHKGPHQAVFTEADTVVRIEWEYLGDRARAHFEDSDAHAEHDPEWHERDKHYPMDEHGHP
jgi:hypothetical protein